MPAILILDKTGRVWNPPLRIDIPHPVYNASIIFNYISCVGAGSKPALIIFTKMITANPTASIKQFLKRTVIFKRETIASPA
ncbi:MAG: hypothetical protein DM484_21180 [Candidatus Methylumidiphilus alinenensis]|uniref:Uncharacterized protein n=1 Tax=Candidatus Methylumidiphilus alinenensis TaxID=2202197 RepID=A0A2W4QTQ5_9GAMM|nr:MAG: hypothetical protein DM484_21180 [Candidatus Methylumidiphilus alinenensis]